MIYNATDKHTRKSTFFESRAETYRGIAAAAVKALYGSDCIARAAYYRADEVAALAEATGVTERAAALMVLLDDARVMDAKREGFMTTVGHHVAVDVYDVLDEVA